MSKPCCINSPRIFRDKQWVCSECDSIIFDEKQLDFFDYNIPKEEKKCDCGAESLYGKDTPGHYPMCSINKK